MSAKSCSRETIGSITSQLILSRFFANKDIELPYYLQSFADPLPRAYHRLRNGSHDPQELSTPAKDTGSLVEQKLSIENMRKNIGRTKSKIAKENQLLSLLKEDEEDGHNDTIKQIEVKILNLELGLSEEERLVQELDEKVRWIDWVGRFSDKIFGAIIIPNSFWFSTSFGDPIEAANNPFG